MGGGAVGEGVIVDLTAMQPRRLEIDADRRIAWTSGAVTVTELNEAAGRHGLRMPVEPSSARFATLAGMVACNAAGARTLKHGAVRSWVRGLRAGDRRRGDRLDSQEQFTARPPATVRESFRAGPPARPSPFRNRLRPSTPLAGEADPRHLPPHHQELLRLRSRSLARLRRLGGPPGRQRGDAGVRHGNRVAPRAGAAGPERASPYAQPPRRPGRRGDRPPPARPLRHRAARQDLPRPGPPEAGRRGVAGAAALRRGGAAGRVREARTRPRPVVPPATRSAPSPPGRPASRPP